jgi:hypothetical protein
MRLTLLTLMPYRSASSRCGVPARLSVRLADDLLAQSVDEPPAPASRRRGSGAVVVELDMGDRLGSMRHYVPNIRVRVEAHKLHCGDTSVVLFEPQRGPGRPALSAPEECVVKA